MCARIQYYLFILNAINAVFASIMKKKQEKFVHFKENP